jgi:hypothetical protein
VVKFPNYEFINADYQIVGHNITIIEQLPTQYTIRVDNTLDYDYQVIAKQNNSIDILNIIPYDIKTEWNTLFLEERRLFYQ